MLHGQNIRDILHSPNLLVPSSCLVSERTGNPEGATGPRRTRLSTLEAAILFAFLWKLRGLIAGFSSLHAELEKEGGTACIWSTLQGFQRTLRLLLFLRKEQRWRSQRSRPEVRSASVTQTPLHLK